MSSASSVSSASSAASAPTASSSRRVSSAELIRGGLGGLVSGILFAVATMWFVTTLDMPAKTPLLMISTIVLGDEAMATGEASVPVGLVVHLVLSALFGVVFAALVSRLRTNGAVALAGLVYGALLYLLNFQILARLAFETFKMANQPFELVVHIVFGALLALALYNTGARRGEPLLATR
jgi:uncharacterized membrane protein YagU involved in acid resistance